VPYPPPAVAAATDGDEDYRFSNLPCEKVNEGLPQAYRTHATLAAKCYKTIGCRPRRARITPPTNKNPAPSIASVAGSGVG